MAEERTGGLAPGVALPCTDGSGHAGTGGGGRRPFGGALCARPIAFPLRSSVEPKTGTGGCGAGGGEEGAAGAGSSPDHGGSGTFQILGYCADYGGMQPVRVV